MSGSITGSKTRRQYGTLAARVGIIINLFLAVLKFVLGAVTGSISIRADAVNNLGDFTTSVLSLVVFKVASKPADKKHPFGHARIEYMASMVLSFFLLVLGVDLLKTSVFKIINPQKMHYSVYVLIALAFTVILKIVLGLFYNRIAGRINSTVLKANAVDSFSDAVSTLSVFAGALISNYTDLNLDGYVGFVVSLFLFYNAFKILNDTKNYILGSPVDETLVEKIREFALENEEIIAIHDLYIHNYGPGISFATFHAEVDGKKDIFLTHDAVDSVEKGVFEKFGVHCTIHLDPIVTDDEKVTELKNKVVEITKDINERLTIHDFRMVPGETHSNLIFDVLAPYDLKISDEEIKEQIEIKTKETANNLFTVITVDRG